MLLSSQQGLRWRLLAGFLSCAIITGFSAVLGIFGLSQIHGRIRSTTAEISARLERQNERNGELRVLRELRQAFRTTAGAESPRDADARLAAAVDSGKLSPATRERLEAIRARMSPPGKTAPPETLRREREAVAELAAEAALELADAGEYGAVVDIERTLTGLVDRYQILQLLLGVGAFALAIGIGVVVARSITAPLSRVIASLTAGAQEASTVARQLSSANREIAEGAKEQSAAVQETSGSMQQVASATHQNAQHAEEAEQLMEETMNLVSRGLNSMDRMSRTIAEIKKSADDTAKIVGTIDEIAFQTNLLSLNAAIEAARAGEAGKGFAVVASEVRNLARRSAEAARSTAELIRQSIQRAETGVTVSTESGSALQDITASVRKVGQLVAGISSSSREQAVGIQLINSAVARIDGITQQSSSSTEQSATIARMLDERAVALEAVVRELRALAQGAE